MYEVCIYIYTIVLLHMQLPVLYLPNPSSCIEPAPLGSHFIFFLQLKLGHCKHLLNSQNIPSST